MHTSSRAVAGVAASLSTWAPHCAHVGVSEGASLPPDLASPCVFPTVTRHVFSFHVGSSCLSAHPFAQAIVDCRRVFEMGRRVGHEMNLLDIGGGFPGAEGLEPMFEEVRGEEERRSRDRVGFVYRELLEPSRVPASSRVGFVERSLTLHMGPVCTRGHGGVVAPWLPLDLLASVFARAALRETFTHCSPHTQGTVPLADHALMWTVPSSDSQGAAAHTLAVCPRSASLWAALSTCFPR